jgi:hypothetical protein
VANHSAANLLHPEKLLKFSMWLICRFLCCKRREKKRKKSKKLYTRPLCERKLLHDVYTPVYIDETSTDVILIDWWCSRFTVNMYHCWPVVTCQHSLPIIFHSLKYLTFGRFANWQKKIILLQKKYRALSALLLSTCKKRSYWVMDNGNNMNIST